MSDPNRSRWPPADYSASYTSPLRGSPNFLDAPTSLTAGHTPALSSRLNALSSTSANSRRPHLAHKRGLSEASNFQMLESNDENFGAIQSQTSDHIKNARRSLRPLPQAPGPSPPTDSKHQRSRTLDVMSGLQANLSLGSSSNHASASQSSPPRRVETTSPQSSPNNRPHVQHAHTTSQITTLSAPDIQQLQKSVTGHFKTLSRIARDGETDEFAMTLPTPSVVGLQGRRQLKRADSERPSKSVSRPVGSAWEQRNWMDKQRQFLQAYEYLCHIGEAKEWIEDIIQQPIPPIVELEEALRDGVTLAEIVQSLNPDRSIRIFHHPRLQYRHSDNIALFFRYLEQVELPELFRFELIDLYEKKNIPKVIYCIHALSWLLYRKGIVDFRIGNLVGQLEFEHHELEQMQKGLDKSGVNMPSFSGVGANFGIEPEPEPEPVETEADRIERELGEAETSIAEFQCQTRGALLRLQLSKTMSELWDNEEALVELQSKLRGDFAREIVGYRLTMRQFAINLQAASRGFLIRRRHHQTSTHWKQHEQELLGLQSIIRAVQSRCNTQRLQSVLQQQDLSTRSIQAAIRGALMRKSLMDDYAHIDTNQSELIGLQAAIRGMICRKRWQDIRACLSKEGRAISSIQACVRGLLSRIETTQQRESLSSKSITWVNIEAAVRGKLARDAIKNQRRDLELQAVPLVKLQSHMRSAQSRKKYSHLLSALFAQSKPILELQRFSRGMLCRRTQARTRRSLQAYANELCELQALGRAALARIDVAILLDKLSGHEDEISNSQAAIRAMLSRLRITQLLSDLEADEECTVDLQAMARGFVVRQKFEKRKQHFKENMEKVIKIQSIARAKIQGQAYKSLTSGQNPPVGTLKGFVHLLNDSDFDFDEELEFERLRKTVVSHVRQNELADQYISQLDIKIALLVKNKITLDEVVKHQRHFGGHIGSLLPNADISSKDPFDLRALNKTSRTKLEHYQELFFLLQTQPQYLSRLFRRLREQGMAEKECEKIKHLMMGLFGYAQKRREEYYLVKLLSKSIREEVDSCGSVADWVRSTPFFNRLFSAYTKSPRDRKFMRDVLGPIVKENIIENRELDLESDPMQIYLSAINNEELRTGQRSHRRRDVRREEAIRDPETRATFIAHLQDLRDIADSFFVALEEMLHRMPFGVRYIGQQMFQSLLNRFAAEDEGYILQVTGQWMWRSYLLPALIEPEKSGVVDRGLTQEQKKNLAEISKVLGQIAAGRLFGGENVYLQPLNSYITESIQRLGDIWQNMLTVEDAETHFDIGEFNDLYAKTKPTLYIKMADIFSIHHLVATETISICPNQDDVLREIMRELGSVKSNESELMGVGSSEIGLTLTPKLHTVEDPDAEIKALFMETKRCILYIIRVQSGSSLLEIMVKPITEEDELRWDVLVRDELVSGGRKRGAYSDAHNLIDISALSYSELKRMALENILHLEQVGRVSRANHYQDLLNAIAIDIRTKHRRRIQRQRELEGVRMTLQRLNDQANYLEQQLKTYNDYIEQAMVTLQNKKGKKRFLMPFTKQWDHERELQRSGRHFKFGSFKYSARNLADKGVLVHWKGYTERQWEKVDLTVSSNAVGVFTIDGSSGNMMIPGANAQVPLDDLLQAQFNNTQFIEFFEGALRVNVNLFLHLIMRKFYNE